jgi:hypothetical protein
VGLGGVLDDLEAARVGELDDRAHGGAEAVEVNRHDRAGARPDGSVELVGVERPRVRVHVHEHRPGTGALDAGDGRNAGVGRGEHLVARPHPHRLERQRDRVGARGDADGVPRSAVRRELALEALDCLAADEPAALEHARDRLLDLVPLRGQSASEVEERDSHGSSQ